MPKMGTSPNRNATPPITRAAIASGAVLVATVADGAGGVAGATQPGSDPPAGGMPMGSTGGGTTGPFVQADPSQYRLTPVSGLLYHPAGMPEVSGVGSVGGVASLMR